MENFESMLLRLKEQLSAQTDREVAELLGLSVKAFTARKMRGAFPVDKVLALKASMPDLNVDYVLTGDPAALVAGSLRKAKEELAKFKQDLSIQQSQAPYTNRRIAWNQSFDMLDESSRRVVEAMIAELLTKQSKGKLE